MRHTLRQPEPQQGRGRVAAADDRGPRRGGHRLGDRARPGRERGELERAHRPIPEHRPRARDHLGIRSRGLGADVEPHPPVGDVEPVELEGLHVLGELLRHHQVHGQLQTSPGRRPRVEYPARQLHVFRRTQRVPDRMALRGQKREAHRATDQDRVGGLAEPIDHADLVAHLGAAEHRHKRPVRGLEHAHQCLHLALEQQAGRTLVHQPRDALGRRVRPVRGPERIVYVHVGERGQLARELGVVLGLPRLVANVLEQQQVTVAQPVDRRPDLVADDARRDAHRGGEELAQAHSDRRQRQRRVAILRPPQMRHEHDPGAAPAQLLDRRQRGADPQVVRDGPVLERDVEVHPDQHALALEVAQVPKCLHNNLCATSTTRLE